MNRQIAQKYFALVFILSVASVSAADPIDTHLNEFEAARSDLRSNVDAFHNTLDAQARADRFVELFGMCRASNDFAWYVDPKNKDKACIAFAISEIERVARREEAAAIAGKFR